MLGHRGPGTALAATHGRDPEPGWAELRDEIADDVLAKGWNDEAQAFTTAYDGMDLDAASLHIGLSGMIDPRDVAERSLGNHPQAYSHLGLIRCASC